MKKILIGTLALMASGTVLANGFYAGLGAGVLNFSNKTTTTIATSDTTPTGLLIPYSQSASNNTLAINGEVLAGYTWDLRNHYVLSLEAFASDSNAKISSQQTGDLQLSETSNFTLNSVYGVRLLPGYQVTPDVEVYGIIGFSHANTSLDNTMDISSNVKSQVFTNDQGFQFNGYQLGFGSKVALNQHLALRGDVIYTGYPTKTTTNTYPFIDTTLTDTYKLQPSSLEANIVLLYQFG